MGMGNSYAPAGRARGYLPLQHKVAFVPAERSFCMGMPEKSDPRGGSHSSRPGAKSTVPTVRPAISAPLDPKFQPAVLFNREYDRQVRASGHGVPLVLGLERENGRLSRHETLIDPSADATTLRYVERLVKFLLWARGGWKPLRLRSVREGRGCP